MQGRSRQGWFVNPTIYADVTNEMRIAREEVFGPVLSVIRFKDLEEAVAIANDTPYGLASGVWTQSMATAIEMSKRLRAGTVWINTYRAIGYMSPFGGYKASGLGRENGMEAIDAYLQTKCVWLSTASHVPIPSLFAEGNGWMRGVVFLGDRKLEIQNFPDPTPGPGEVVLEIKASGMCGSDLKFYRAKEGAKSLGFTMADGPVIGGHEPCGEVVAVGPGVPENQAWVGMRAMQHHYLGCGVCPHCSTGWMQLCVEGVRAVYGITAHGAHARYMRCPARTLVQLPEELSWKTGAAISCGTGTAWNALHRLSLMGDQTIAIFGQGPVGLAATQLATAMGAQVIALDPSPRRRERAREMGAASIIDPTTDDPVELTKNLTHGRGAHLSLDTSGVPQARRQAVRCLRTWGKACFVGEGDSVTLDVSNDLLRRQVTIIASWTFSTIDQAACARYVADRRINVDALFTHNWRLDQAGEAYTPSTAKPRAKPSSIPMAKHERA